MSALYCDIHYDGGHSFRMYEHNKRLDEERARHERSEKEQRAQELEDNLNRWERYEQYALKQKQNIDGALIRMEIDKLRGR